MGIKVKNDCFKENWTVYIRQLGHFGYDWYLSLAPTHLILPQSSFQLLYSVQHLVVVLVRNPTRHWREGGLTTPFKDVLSLWVFVKVVPL